jgi:(p)ppGpp synthase/HD superfamily hydrolase
MLTQRFDDALAFAHELHRRQSRKGNDTPYIAHLLGVSSLVLEHGGDEDEAIAALLHDAVEDQGGRPTGEAIAARFGERVADIVWGCTDAEIIPKPPWEARKQAYLDHLVHAPASVLLVSSADKLYNARTILSDHDEIGDRVFDRFSASKSRTLWYYRGLVSAYRRAAHFKGHPGIARLVRDLDAVVTALEARG